MKKADMSSISVNGWPNTIDRGKKADQRNGEVVYLQRKLKRNSISQK